MMSRKLAMVDTESEAAQVFRSMLEVIGGRTRCAWQLTASIEQADAIVDSGNRLNDAEPMAAIGKPVIAILDQHSPLRRPNTPYVLTHPFRVMQVLSLLDDIADSRDWSTLRAVHETPPTPWSFAESVRAIAAESSPASWYRTCTAHGNEIVVTGNLRNFACEAAVFEQVRRGTTILSALVPARVQSVPLGYVRHPLFELLWPNAYHAAPTLAPWLQAGGSFHIRRWPDFGTIAATRQQLQLVAMLARRRCTRQELAQATHAGSADVDSLLNALSMCDLLVHEYAPMPVRMAATAPLPAFMRALLGNLRRTLRMAY